jgi:hypothetical protein
VQRSCDRALNTTVRITDEAMQCVARAGSRDSAMSQCRDPEATERRIEVALSRRRELA